MAIWSSSSKCKVQNGRSQCLTNWYNRESSLIMIPGIIFTAERELQRRKTIGVGTSFGLYHKVALALYMKQSHPGVRRMHFSSDGIVGLDLP